MKVTGFKVKGNWIDVLNSARSTVGKDEVSKEPNSSWKARMILAEHSPIRRLTISWKWVDLMYWVSVHFVRHKIGIEHFVKTQRSDRTGVLRYKSPQDTPVVHEVEANAQSLINISRKRLCHNASPETQEAWQKVLIEVELKEPELFQACVPECVYRGFCPDMNTCGYSDTDKFHRQLQNYRAPVVDWRKENGTQKM